jgi:hypothetical protein
VLTDPTRTQFISFRTAFRDRHLAGGGSRDGWVIMSHDALLTATRAISNAAGQTDVAPDAGSVLGQLYLLKTSNNPVDGAGGTFQLDPNTGDPVGRLLTDLPARRDRRPCAGRAVSVATHALTCPREGRCSPSLRKKSSKRR